MCRLINVLLLRRWGVRVRHHTRFGATGRADFQLALGTPQQPDSTLPLRSVGGGSEAILRRDVTFLLPALIMQPFNPFTLFLCSLLVDPLWHRHFLAHFVTF